MGLYSRFAAWMFGRQEWERQVIVWAFVGVVGGGATLLYNYVTRGVDPAFAVRMHKALISLDSDEAMRLAPFWVLPQGRDGKIRIPAAATLVLSITNMQSTPTTIEQVRLEITNSDDQWVTLTRLPSQAAEVMALNGTLLGGDTVFLDRELEKRPLLQPRAALKGWIFFEYPRSLHISKGHERYRVMVGDAATNYTTGDLPIPTGDRTWSSATPWVELVAGDKVDPNAYRKVFLNP
jgi:hypothetical protein